ncbi:glycosyltransferase family 4 protein [Kushneria indalinina]|uniref:Glycosyltransferase involved in cell wall biosynthesis n=1 Tax=Kushneria indalinina DSM 14324 TaxID=1122140 RepID=A0A3D9DYH2_9GAMM|nr:glycosyltransferase family 4 protein [Kushneria indalinina]REC95751.1 glycosyltransferase involved in cell wall biosynthesis [Kushneria indalinina DSM 14324]
MKKVCFIINNMGLGGGTERVALTIINTLADKGHDITLLNLWQDDNVAFFNISPRVKVNCLSTSKASFYLGYFSIVKKIRSFVTTHDFDTVINVESTLSLFVAPALFAKKVRHVNWEHYNFTASNGSKLRTISRYVAAWMADTVVTLTHLDAEVWKKRTKPRAEILPINNPLPFAQEEYNYNPDARVVLAIGRFSYQKGFDSLLSAWAQVVRDTQGWELRIVGNGEDGAALQTQVQELGIEDSVTFCPPTKDIENHYREAGIYCMSSRFEGLPMVLIEANAYGLPIVSFNCLTGPSEVVEDKVSGLLAAPEDIDELAEKLKYLIEHRNERIKFSRAAYSSSPKFRLENIIKQWEELVS